MLEFESNESRMNFALGEAMECLRQLDNATSLREEKTAWVVFLTAIDILRQSITDTCKSDTRLNKWHSSFANEVKADPLLIYMRNARNNIQHLVTKPPIGNPVALSLQDKSGRPFAIDSIKSSLTDGVLTISLESKSVSDDMDWTTELYRASGRALTVRNMGVEYPAPIAHKDAPLASDEIHYLAALTLGYYDDAVKELMSIICDSDRC